MFRRLELLEQGWLGTVTEWGRRFHRAVGSLDRLRGLSRQVGQHWLQGTEAAQATYARHLLTVLAGDQARHAHSELPDRPISIRLRGRHVRDRATRPHSSFESLRSRPRRP